MRKQAIVEIDCSFYKRTVKNISQVCEDHRDCNCCGFFGFTEVNKKMLKLWSHDGVTEWVSE